MNTFGRLLRLTSWGESHGTALGGVLDGMPAGIPIDLEQIQLEVWRRTPGRSTLASPRAEQDRVEILSGVYEGRTLGTPISFLVRNADSRWQDYDHLRDIYRPGHADYTYQVKYGHRDHRGGGRSSARETLVRVVAGALVRPWLYGLGIEVAAWASRVGEVQLPSERSYSWSELMEARQRPLRCPDLPTEEAMQSTIEQARAQHDSIGGVISCRAIGVPAGLGAPIYDKLSARLAYAMMSINAVRGFELGDGFTLAEMYGSRANDPMTIGRDGAITQATNHAGGTLGGISTGAPLEMRIALKPTPTIGLAQQTVDRHGRSVELSAHGRHDPSVVTRAIPVVEAMCLLCLGDMVLLRATDHPILSD